MRTRTRLRAATRGLSFDLCTPKTTRTVWRCDVACARCEARHASEIGAVLFVPPLVRDKLTLRTMKRPAGPAGTREAYKRVYPLVEQVTSMVLHGAATFLIDPYAVEREATLRRSSQGAKRAHLQRVRRMLRGWGWNVKRARVRGNLSAWHWSHWDGIAWGNSRVS